MKIEGTANSTRDMNTNMVCYVSILAPGCNYVTLPSQQLNY